MTDLRQAAQQALDDLRDLHANHNITCAGTITALESALAQEQAEPLTEEEIIDATEHIDTSRNGYFIHIARAIERAHGIGDNT